MFLPLVGTLNLLVLIARCNTHPVKSQGGYINKKEEYQWPEKVPAM